MIVNCTDYSNRLYIAVTNKWLISNGPRSIVVSLISINEIETFVVPTTRIYDIEFGII